jgi:cytochrome c551/c552
MSALLVACGSKEESAAKNVANVPTAAKTFTPGLDAGQDKVAEESPMPQLARKNNCAACHSIDKKIVGPAWKDVALKYKGATKFEYNGKEYPLEEGLVMKVSLGGSGHWSSMPMPANDPSGAKKADITELVRFILGLAK